MNVLLLNLARFGDLLQGQAAIRDLQAQGHRVAVVCLENFLGAAALLSGVERLFPLPGSGLLTALEQDAAQDALGRESRLRRPWHQGLARLGTWKQALEADFAPDAVCNLTPAIAPRLLARYLAGEKNCTGYFVDSHGFGLDGNAWASYLKASAGVRGASPFNIVDIFRKAAAFDPALPLRPGNAFLTPPAADMRRRAARKLALAAPGGSGAFVALQLGASQVARQWPVDCFVALGEHLWREEGLCPVLLGSEAERALAGEYAAASRAPFVDMCGRTSLEELASLLCACRMLVTNDTGTMHLAAGLDVPVLALFMATAQPFDTGPYREDCLCLEPDLPCHPCSFGANCPHGQACRRALEPDMVAELALGHARRGVWSAPESVEGARLWLTRLDDQGFMDLVSLSGHGVEARAVWLRLLRLHLRPFLNGENPEPVADAAVGPGLPEPLRTELRERLDTAARLTDLLQEQGRVLLGKAPPVMRERFLANWDRIRTLLGADEKLAALSMLWSQVTQEADVDFQASLRAVARFSGFVKGLARSLV